MIALITALVMTTCEVGVSLPDSTSVYAADTVVAEGCRQRMVRYSCADSLGNESRLWATDTEYLPVPQPGAYDPCPVRLRDVNGEDIAVDLTVTGNEPCFAEMPGGGCALQLTRGVALTVDDSVYTVCSYYYEYAVDADGTIRMISARPVASDLTVLMSEYNVYPADSEDESDPLTRGQILSRLSVLLPPRLSVPLDGKAPTEAAAPPESL